MTHQFDVDEAVAFGVPEAILLQSLRIWQAGNAANGTHYYQGRTWVRMPVHRMLPYFRYWKNQRAIYRVLKSLVSQKALLVDNFNVCRRNRTLFYSVADQGTVPLTDTISPLMIPAGIMQQLQIEQEDEDGQMPNDPTTQAHLTNLSNEQNKPSGQLTDLSNAQLTNLSNGQNRLISQLTKTENANTENGELGIRVDSIKVNKDLVSSGVVGDEPKLEQVQPSATPPPPSSFPIPDFVLRNRASLSLHQTITPDQVWCQYLNVDQSKDSLKKIILDIYQGTRGETFAMQKKIRIDEPFVEAFVEQRAMNEDIRSQRNLGRLLEFFASDMGEATTRRRPTAVKGTSYDPTRPINFGSYEID
jgi:hypothetical protein